VRRPQLAQAAWKVKSLKGKSMKKQPIILAIVLALISGATGYQLHRPPATAGSADDFAAEQSFSEVQNTKDNLAALSTQIICSLRDRAGNPPGSSPRALAGTVAPAPNLTGVIRDLESETEAFKGTEQESVLTGELLRALNKAGLPDRWVQVYLSFLYTHPTDDAVGHFANQAVRMGKAAGRGQEVLDAFRHLNAIPLDFAAKHQVETALLRTGTTAPIARNDSDSVR
jgi:hypothetical protein